jgi:hypothetical protein
LSNDSLTLAYFTNTGLVIFGLDNYSDLNVEVSVAGVGNWARKSIFNHFFSYLFDELQVPRASAIVHPDNRKSIKLITRLGFKHEVRLRGIDLDLYSLLPTDTKYYVRKKTQKANAKAERYPRTVAR